MTMSFRWFVLDDAAGIFSYYTSKSKMSRGERRGCVRLRGALIGIDDEDDSTFTITVDNKTFHFQVRYLDPGAFFLPQRSLYDFGIHSHEIMISQNKTMGVTTQNFTSRQVISIVLLLYYYYSTNI